MELDTLEALYVDELKDLWSAEKQILKALPRMIRAIRASHLGDHQARSPSRPRMAGKRKARTIVASTSTATAAPTATSFT